MKRSSVAFLPKILFKNKLPIAVFSLLVMIAAAFSVMLCEKKITALENKWRSLYELKEISGYADNNAMAEGQLRNLTRYDIKVGLTWSVGRIEIQFCDKYSFFLLENLRLSGVYYKTGHSPGKYVSTVNYQPALMRGKRTYDRLRDLNLRIKCDLIEKTALIYINGKLMEEIQLGPGPVGYGFGLAMQRGNKRVILNKLEVSDHEGKNLFRADFASWSLYKHISQVLLFLGVLIFLVLACSEKFFFRRVLFFVIPLFFLEVFLRAAYSQDPNLDIHQLKPKWRFEISTNFFGAFNGLTEISINSYMFRLDDRRIYPIENPEHAVRIVCIGSSPLWLRPSAGQPFPALLEKKLDSWNGKKNMVIPIAIPQVEYFNSVEPNVFLKEVLSRLNPDLVLYYAKLAFMEGMYKELYEKDCILYHRAKRIMEKNSDWIKNGRLLYAALEFKEPIKEVVYLYDFLCNSYLFMAVESIRKRLLEEWHLEDGGTSAEKTDSFFNEVLELCKAKGIKVVFIPQLDFSKCSNDKQTEDFLANLRMKHPEIFSLNLEGILAGNENFLLAEDRGHLREYGHQVIAQEIFRQLTEKGLLDIR